MGVRTEAITRGAMTLLEGLGFASLREVTLPNRRRADVFALGAKGEVIIVEVKSSVADFQSDQKWQDYRPYCDRFYFAVAPSFPGELIPQDVGLIVADGFGGAVVREPLAEAIAAARRKALTLRFARLAALRLMADAGHDTSGIQDDVLSDAL